MARIPIPCGHVDYPCCGCDNVALTGEDAIEQMREEDDLSDVEADAMTLASAGMGMNEDYGVFGPDLFDIEAEDRMSGGQ